MTASDRLRRWMDRQGLTIRGAATVLGVSHNAVYKVLQGRTFGRKLAKVLSEHVDRRVSFNNWLLMGAKGVGH